MSIEAKPVADETDRLPLFPFTRTRQFELPAQYAEARGGCPVTPVQLWNGQKAWLLTRHADFCSVLVDPRFSGEFARPDFPTVTEARRGIDKAERAFVGMDNPRHDHYRRMLLKEFTAKRMLALRPQIAAITDDLLNAIERKGPPTDLIAALAVEMPALVMCALFGSPYEDHTYIAKCAAGRHGLSQSPEQAAQSAADLVDYCRQLIAKKEANPADDMLSRVIRDYVLTDELSREDLADMCSMILRAGHDTTTNMIGLGTLLFLQHPEQLARLKAEPDLIESAVDELLRYLSPVQFAPRRVALEDAEVNGARIRKGDGIFAVNAAANRDETEFPDPDAFDIGRDASNHLAFGYGIHRCLGQGLARIELQIVFPKLFERFPDLRLATPLESVPFKYDSQIYGLYKLPLEW
ncbi:MAG TPA: cytochrome P450 [Aliidongia sp.]|uniref:cytochrome P450 n=1 Tax=Aliidongia sp. TaxID=1914230 RepID=UPI002DDD1218|nr:cytochrome P450 [Aliidongia sp.]HEV2673776.1 cytochrome P450 [Aliidongia sp.]